MALRVSPPKIFPIATLAPKPPNDAAGSVDAYRQSSFVLGSEFDLVLDGLNLEGKVAEASSGAKFRSQRTASAMGLWSRGWLARLQALQGLQWGNYSASSPLIRAAADHEAAMLYLLRTGAEEWQEWLDAGGIAISAEHHATEFQLHAFRAAEVLAAHDILGPLYRVATDLSLSHFGSTLLLAGAESAPDHVSITFGDRDFHMGLAELHLGWLLELGIAQFEALDAGSEAFAPLEPGIGSWLSEARKVVENSSRCRVEQIESDGMRRYLVHNWRREPRSAPKRILL
ncbi:MAG: hypothetical protein AB7J35_12710 [Dehalococcoidia bacterium]